MTNAQTTDRPVIGIVGGGFSGAATAIHLMRDHDPEAKIVIVEPAAAIGRGLAYGTADPVCRINVAAHRMALFSEDPEHFDRWLRARGMPAEDPEGVWDEGRLFPRRGLFGAYVQEALESAHRDGRCQFRHVRARAIAAAPEGAGWALTLDDATVLKAELIVLAATHSAPDLPPPLRALEGMPGFVADPWDRVALDSLPRDADLLIVGSGLTACDVVVSLRARGQRGRIHLLSRRGLLPRPRTTLPVAAYGSFDVDPARSAAALLRRVRVAVRENVSNGGPWEDIVDALRKQAREVWDALLPSERHRLLRHLRPFWDAHRFQSAPQVEAVIRSERAAGTLELVAGALLRLEPAGDGTFDVEFHRRGAPPARTERIQVGGIVNCTGPGHRSLVERHPLFGSLARTAGLHADEWHLGIAVDGRSRVLGSEGAWANLFVAGPLARGTHGELMGLPQVSMQPREVAGEIAKLLAKKDRCSAPGPRSRRSPLEPVH